MRASPGVPGARPPKSSAASVRTTAVIRAGSIGPAFTAVAASIAKASIIGVVPLPHPA